MKYEAVTSSSQFPFPNHNIDPKDKGADWCMAYAKAALYSWLWVGAKAIFSNNGGDYAKYKMYAQGKQPIDIYKKTFGVDSVTNETQLVVDWSVRAVVSGYREKFISRILKQDYGIVCTPIDIEAKTKMNDYYATLKAKLATRQLLLQQNPELASHPMISLQSGEPLDIEELEMRMEMGEQFNRAKDAEMAIGYGFYINDYKHKRKQWLENIFDTGVAGYKEWLGDDNLPKFRVCDNENVVVSVSQDGTFKDIVHAGELIYVPLVDLAVMKDADGGALFTDKELEEFAVSATKMWGNPMTLGNGNNFMKPWDKFKAQVLDIYFYTWNDSVYRVAPDENGNLDFRKADFGRGRKSQNYKRNRIKYVYKCKWVVGTDKCYDFGMVEDQKRSVEPKKMAETTLPFKFVALNFYNMRAQGFMERLIPYLDDLQNTYIKIQNFKNRAVPSGWWIDMSALEAVAMKKGGKDMTPQQLLQMFFETGVLVGRSEEEGGSPRPNNWKPVIPIENTAASELAMFYQDVLTTISAIEKITGYNDVTMGQAPSKTLVPGYETAQQSTNEAIFPVQFAEESLCLQLAADVYTRIQQGVQKSGAITGYAPGLNTNTLKFIEISPDISLKEVGIELEKESTQDEKAWLMSVMAQDIAAGYLTSADAVTLVNTKNVKQAQEIWAYKSRRAKEQMQNEKMQQLQSTNQANLQAASIAQQTALQTLQMQGQIEIQKKQIEVQGEIQKTAMKIQAEKEIALQSNWAKMNIAETTGLAKIHSTDLAGEHNLQKQALANNKPSSTSSN